MVSVLDANMVSLFAAKTSALGLNTSRFNGRNVHVNLDSLNLTGDLRYAAVVHDRRLKKSPCLAGIPMIDLVHAVTAEEQYGLVPEIATRTRHPRQ